MSPTLFAFSRLLRRIAALSVLTGMALGPFARGLRGAEETPAITANPGASLIETCGQFWDLSEADKRILHPIRLEVVIFYYDPEWKLCWADDGKSSTYLTTAMDEPLPFKSGQKVLIEGSVVPSTGLTAKSIKVTVLSEAEKIVPVVVKDQADTSNLNTRFVTIEGYVYRTIDVTKTHWRIEMISEGLLATCTIMHEAGASAPAWNDSLVRASGVLINKADSSGQIDAVDLWVGTSKNVEILGPLKSDARFKRPATLIENLPAVSSATMVRIVGTVRRQKPAQSLTLRDATGQIEVKTPQALPVHIGDKVEAIGYPFLSGSGRTLRHGLFHILQTAAEGKKENNDETLRITDEVLSLTAEEAASSKRVRIRGVVTWSAPGTRFIFVQDASSCVQVDVSAIETPIPSINADVLIEGVTAPGAYASIVKASRVEMYGNMNPPEAHEITLEQALTGVEENQSVELTGYLRSVDQDGPWTRLTLTTSAGEFVARMPEDRGLVPLIGSVVRVQGVCTAVANDRRQLIGIQLWVPWAEYVQIEEAAAADPFAINAGSIASLRQFSTLAGTNRRVKLTGVVLHQVPGRYLLIQDGSEGLLVLSRSTELLSPGDRVEVVGFPGRESSKVLLREAVYRKIPGGGEPAPLPITNFRAANAELDGNLVKASGTLLEAASHGDGIRLMIQVQDNIFEARLEGFYEIPREWTNNSVMSLTGVYQVERDEYSQSRSFHLLLRSPRDVRVITPAPWWTAQRALAASGLVGGCSFLVIGWVVALRRRINQQTSQIRTQLEKESHLEAQHREIIENASDFIFTVNLSGQFTSVNPAGERLTGYTREQTLGMSIRDLIASEDKTQPLPFLEKTPETDGSVTFQSRFKTRTGALTWVETNFQLVFEDGKPSGVLGVVRDINERKKIEEELKRARDAAEAATRAKSAFLANMSHEIRTPMNGVIGMSNLLLDTPLSHEQRDFAETVRNSAEALLTVLNDILDFSKVEAGRLQFETLDFDLRETIDGAMELLAGRAASKGLEFAAFIPHDLPCLLRGDPGRLRQIVLNLLGNAVKFTEKGEVILDVSLEEQTEHGVRLLFKVTDTGIGLSAVAQSRIFQAFSQGDDSTNRRFGGTGLGLAISKQIVELMEGRIGVESTVGQGATFWFSVNLAKQLDDRSPEPVPSVASLKGLRVLVVDDNATNRRIVQHYLTGWGMRSDPVASGIEALQVLGLATEAKEKFQLILLDYHMPEMDGLALAQAIRRQCGPDGPGVILLTSLDNRFPSDQLAEAGIVRMLTKPVRQTELLRALLKGLGRETGSKPPTPRATEETEQEKIASNETHKSLRVLVAEDNIVNQRVTLLQLQKLGHRAEVAANGLEVLDAMERIEYDVILMDCQMPEMDGYAATRHLRAHRRHGSVWIIAMTANAMQGDREECLEAGMNDYVSKPTRLEDLRLAFERLGKVLKK